MVDDVKNITETAESKAQADAIDRARLARERREAEQRKRLDELRAHAAAAQAQREKRDEERRRRQAEQRAKDDDRRLQVEERKRAIWEASISRREALLQRERDRSERMERARAARSAPRPAFAFGSSTPRLLEPLDSAGFFWAARSTNPIDQMNFFESLAASTTNVMFASAPLTRRASALQLDISDNDNKDEPERCVAWSSVARRRTDLVPTAPARPAGRASSMTRLDRLDRPDRPDRLTPAKCRSGETTPSRPGSALAHPAPPPRRAPRRPRPASIAGTGVHTPAGGAVESGGASVATTPGVSRDSSALGAVRDTPSGPGRDTPGGTGRDTPGRANTAVPEVPRRNNPRRPRPVSMHATTKPNALSLGPGEGKPPVHRKPKSSKDHEKSVVGESQTPPGRESPAVQNQQPTNSSSVNDKSQVSAIEVTQKLEALQVQNGQESLDNKVIESKETVATTEETNSEQSVTDVKPVEIEVQKPVEKTEVTKPIEKTEVTKPIDKVDIKKVEEVVEVRKEEVRKDEEKRENVQEKTEESEMTASMTARRITTEEEAKAALAERRRRAREELERQAELERQRLQREAEEEAERQRQEEERQKREEEEARELAALQRRMEEEKLRKAIEAQQQLEREENERRQREEAEKKARLKEEEEKRKAAEDAERLRREDAEREEKERLARKQRVEAIMARTRLKKQQEEEKKQEEKNSAPASEAPPDNGNVPVADLLGPPPTQQVQNASPQPPTDNGNGLIPDAPHQSDGSLEPKPNGNLVEFGAHNGHPHPLTLHNAL